MIELTNPVLPQIGKSLVNGYFDYIDTAVCIDQGFDKFYVTDPHVTLIYDLEPIGENMMYHILKMENRDLYNKLKSDKLMVLDEVVFDTFDNGDYRVLKVNLTNSNKYELLKEYSQRLTKYPNDWKYGDPYSPHLTLTYLKKDTPDSVIEDMNNKLAGNSLKVLEMTNFVLSAGEGQRSKIPIRG